MSRGVSLQRLMKVGGQRYTVVREGARIHELEGLPNQERDGRHYVGVYPGADLRPGDWIEGLVSKDRFYVVDVTSDVLNGQVFQVKGYVKTRREYEESQGQGPGETPNMTAARVAPGSKADPKKVFVVHGRNHAARDAMFSFLQALNLSPIEWDDAVQATGEGSPHIGRVLDAAFELAQAVVVLLTGDDEATLLPHFRASSDPEYETEPTPQPRPNVIFEAGMAFGCNPERTILVQIGHLRPFSDVSGRYILQFGGGPEDRVRLKERLKTVGCIVKESGTFWLTAGDFAEASPRTAS